MVPVVILVETNFVTLLFILSHVSTQRMRGGETNLDSYVKIYAVFSDVVIMHLCTLLHRTLWQSWPLKALHKLQH